MTLGTLIAAPSASGQGFAGELTDYVDARQQTLLSFGDRSHWLQPWRAYLDTVPATRLRDSVGIVFNVTDAEADARAQLLAASGFKRARFEVGFNSVRYGTPSQLTPPTLNSLRVRLQALKRYGIRPLILLNSNHGGPCPAQAINLRTVQPASAGDTTIMLDAATAAAVAPGRTGFNSFQTTGKAADPLITSVAADGRATLSRPLRRDLPVGTYKGSKLLYEPFRRPLQADGSPEPRFEATLAGWLNYVNVVTREARNALGSQEFDVEIWNELSFGWEFLDVDEYYHPNIDTGQGDTTGEILRRTVAWLRDPAHGVANVGIGNGFASQRHWDAGSTSPPGLTAIDKHPYLYGGMRRFPPARDDEVRPLDAQGDLDGVQEADGDWDELFTPTYDDFHPERYLWATQKYASSEIEMEGIWRDLSPITSEIGGVTHGRATHPEGSPPPDMWITEMNVNPMIAPSSFGLGPSDRLHFQAKATLRTLTAFVNKGAGAVYMYAVNDGNYALVDPAAPAGGEVMSAVKRLTSTLTGAQPIANPRSLSLLHVGDYAGNKQFEGDGGPDHPPLYNRDVLAFLPFQVASGRFVVGVYVMTSNLAKSYDPQAPPTDPTRFDMPPETYRLTIGNVGGHGAVLSATDPLTGESVPVTVVARQADRIVVEMPVTDSPRMLVIDESGAQRAACEDGIDNDGDGRTDYPADPGCAAATDASERGTAKCDDGLDNDGDAKTDFPADVGCLSPTDSTEANAQCADGLDNDADGRIDYPADAQCTSLSDNREL